MARYVAGVKFSENFSSALQYLAMQQYINSHPEQFLLAFLITETMGLPNRFVTEEAGRYAVLATANFVDCIACAPLPLLKSQT